MKSDDQSEVRVLRTATCPSLSARSKITYQIAAEVNAEGVCTPKSEIYIQLTGNSGNGLFNDDRVALTAIQRLLGSVRRVTFVTFTQFFRKKSANSPGFLLAALKAEGLVRPATDDKRKYEPTDGKAFRAVVEALLRSPAATKAIGKQAKPAAVETKPSAPAAATPRKASKKKKP